MEITYDPATYAANQAKHGVSLALAAELEWDTLWAEQDSRFAYREVRMIGYALILTRLYCVAFKERGEECRIISLRKANPREVKRYVSEI